MMGPDGVTSEPVATVGSRVTIRDEYGVETYGIVPAEDSDSASRAISQDSPMARALLGHGAGVVLVRAPSGQRYIKVLGVEAAGE